MTLDGSGNLTIGGNYLHFAGTTGLVNATGGPLFYADANTIIFKMGSGTNGIYFQNYAGTGTLANVDTSGNLTINGATATKPGSTAWVNPSDRALKSVVEPWSVGLEAVLALEPVSYRYMDEAWNLDNTNHIGLDAANAAETIPEMARTALLPDLDPTKPGREVAAVDSGPVLFALINAVKELSARLEVLERG
jgi:hypothetical protein